MSEHNEITALLKLRGWTDEEAKKTYLRWFGWLNEMCKPKNIKDHFKAIEETKYDEMVIVKDIDSVLMCPHHLLPVSLEVHIGYLPNGKILGLSKFARVARDLASPITQEQYTQDIVETIFKELSPRWVMAIVTGMHTCMTCRGIKARDSKTITSAYKLTDDITQLANSNKWREEFMKLVIG